MIKNISIKSIPWIPKIAPPIINANRYIRKAVMNTGSTNIRDDNDVMAITIIIIGDTIPAFTAASPRIKAPTIEMAEEAKLGSFKSLSLKSSKAISIIIASKKAGKGTGRKQSQRDQRY